MPELVNQPEADSYESQTKFFTIIKEKYMSSEFEKFVRKNRGDFDDAKPSDMVWKEIEKSLPARKSKQHLIIRNIYKWSAAAAIFIAAATSVYFFVIKKYSHEDQLVNTKTDSSSSNPENLNSINPEYAVEFKEASLAIQKRQKELQSAIGSDPGLYRKFQEDLNLLDSTYRMLRDNANQSANPDVIIKAMIDNLQLQAELLGRQLMIIRDIKTTKTSKNEKNI